MSAGLAAILLGLVSCGFAAEGGDPPPSFEETCFRTSGLKGFVLLADAQRMLEPIGGDSRMTGAEQGKVKLKGLFRVRQWTPDRVLRISLGEHAHQLRLYAWGDGEGVAMFPTPSGAAYRVTRDPAEGLSKTETRSGIGGLLATDDRRGCRLHSSTYQVRYQDGSFVITKGHVRVMTVPLPKATALYLQLVYDGALYDLALDRAGPAPEEIFSPHRVVVDGAKPSQLNWQEKLPAGAAFKKLDDGNVELVAPENGEPAFATVALPDGPGLYEAIFHIDDADAGTGVALLDAKGEAVTGILFSAGNSGRLMFDFGSPRESWPSGNWTGEQQPVPYAGPRVWLRLVACAGMAKCWISGDGMHWGRILDWRPRQGAWQTIALFTREGKEKKAGASARSIRLRSLQVREIEGLTAAADAGLWAKASAAEAALQLDKNETPEAWAKRIASSAPPGASPSAWRYACTLRAIAASLPDHLAEPMLHRAVSERLEDLPTARARIRLLLDAALVWRPQQDDARRQLELWDRIGRQILNGGDREEFETLLQAYMQVSLGDPPERSGPFSWELIRDAIILFHQEQRAAELARIERFVTFWRGWEPQVSGHPAGPHLERLFIWLNVRPVKRYVRKNAGPIDDGGSISPPVNRQADAVLSELLAVLEGGQHADAARILTGSAPPRGEGLVPSPDDDQLLVSYRVALRMLMARHQECGRALERLFGPADQLKIEQALARGDPAAVEALPLQYCGTPAAALPCQWLGDRALAAADLARAAEWYEEGLRVASPALRPDLVARTRLVAAMLGELRGDAPTGPVSLGGVTVSPQQFEGWVRDQIARRNALPANAQPALPAIELSLAGPAKAESAAVGEWKDQSGRGFRHDDMPNEFREIDWTWRQLQVLAEDDLLIVLHRLRIAAFEPGGNKIRWTCHLGNRWSPAPVRPLFAAGKVMVRAAVAPERTGVIAIDRRTGRKLWLADCGGSAISDPLWHRGRLFVLATGPAVRQFHAPLCLVELHPETGDLLASQQIVDMIESVNIPAECQAAWVGNRLVVVMSGNVLSLDLQGRIAWLRQGASLPYQVDPNISCQVYQPPLTWQGRILVQQPGSCAIECLDAETGQRLWRRGVVDLQGMVDLDADRLLARTARGLVALRKASGELLWQREFPGMLPALARTAKGLLLGARQSMDNGKPVVEFFWIDAADGRMRACNTAPLSENRPILFGPIAARGNRAWYASGFGARNDSPTAENPRQIMELRLDTPADKL